MEPTIFTVFLEQRFQHERMSSISKTWGKEEEQGERGRECELRGNIERDRGNNKEERRGTKKKKEDMIGKRRSAGKVMVAPRPSGGAGGRRWRPKYASFLSLST